VGERIEMDGKGRVTIPASMRRVIGRSAFTAEFSGKDAIVLRAAEDRRELVKRVASIRLTGERDRAGVDAATVKDRYGGVKD